MAAYLTEGCGRCGVQLIQAATRNGRTVALDAEPARGGTYQLTDRGTLQPLAEKLSIVAQFGRRDLHRPHTETCTRPVRRSR